MERARDRSECRRVVTAIERQWHADATGGGQRGLDMFDGSSVAVENELVGAVVHGDGDVPARRGDLVMHRLRRQRAHREQRAGRDVPGTQHLLVDRIELADEGRQLVEIVSRESARRGERG